VTLDQWANARPLFAQDKSEEQRKGIFPAGHFGVFIGTDDPKALLFQAPKCLRNIRDLGYCYMF
jgi:hypothetical protein